MCSRHRIVDCPTWPQIHLLGLQQMQKPWLGRTLCRQRRGLECHRHNVQSPMSCDDPVASMAPQCKSSVHRSELWANDCTDVITVSNPHTLQRLLWILQDASLCSDKPEFTAGSFRKRPPRLFFSNAHGRGLRYFKNLLFATWQGHVHPQHFQNKSESTLDCPDWAHHNLSQEGKEIIGWSVFRIAAATLFSGYFMVLAMVPHVRTILVLSPSLPVPSQFWSRKSNLLLLLYTSH